MSLLIPLGFLGLLGLAVLLLIYIIKPNYQQKLVSSTFVWKLSLKYQKKRLPVSKLRNLLILLCQILILVLCSFILTQPIVAAQSNSVDNEKVIIIDASASMRSTYDGETRFERAVYDVQELAEEVFDKKGRISVILAGTQAEFLVQRVGEEGSSELFSALDELLTDSNSCTFGAADIDGAMVLADTVVAENPATEVILYTGKQYLNSNNVIVKDVSLGEEWNVAILNCSATMDEGFYTFSVDIACYGRDMEVTLNCDVNLGSYQNPVMLSQSVILTGDITRTVEFKTGSETVLTNRVFEYESVRVYVQEEDSFQYDNSFVLYGGIKQTLNIQYYSSEPNTFFSASLMSTANALRSRWDVNIDEVRGNSVPARSGYDFYIFENRMPDSLPIDGVVFLVNPSTVPSSTGITLGENVKGELLALGQGETHPLTNYVNTDNILVSSYTPIRTYDEHYTPIMYCAGVPVFVSKKTTDSQVMVMTFSLNYSDMAMTWDFPTLIYNIFQYYMPSTLTSFIYDVNETISLKARGATLKVEGDGISSVFAEFPTTIILKNIGTYTTTQTLLSGDVVTESFYVRVPTLESNIVREIDVLPSSLIKTDLGESYDDLLVYFAAVLVTLLFVEWWLQSRTRI